MSNIRQVQALKYCTVVLWKSAHVFTNHKHSLPDYGTKSVSAYQPTFNYLMIKIFSSKGLVNGMNWKAGVELKSLNCQSSETTTVRQ